MKRLPLTDDQLLGIRIAAKLADERKLESDKRQAELGEALHVAACGGAIDWKAAAQRRDDAHADELSALRILRLRLAESGIDSEEGGSR